MDYASDPVDREYLLKRFRHWKMVEDDAAIRLKQAKRNDEEPRFWADKKEQARRKSVLCALMAEGKEKWDPRRI